ncbi:hypothetical protein PF70_03488, partial [Pseudomonas asplenii]
MGTQVHIAPESTTAVAPARRKPLVRLAVLAAAVAAAVVYGSHWWQTGRFVEDTEDA